MSNYVFSSKDPEELRRVAEEYRYIGRYVTLDEENGQVIVHALPPKKVKKKKKVNEDGRDKRNNKDEEESDGSTQESRPSRRSNGFTRGKYFE